MKNLFRFICMMVAIVVGQSAWAQAEGVVVKNLTWQTTDLKSINASASPRPQFEKTTSDGFMVVNMASESHDVQFVENTDIPLASSDFLSFGHTYANEKNNCTLSWKAASDNYSVVVSSVSTLTKIAGTYCYYSLGGQPEVRISVGWIGEESLDYGWVEQSIANLQGSSSLPFYFRGASNRNHAGTGYGAALNTLKMEYQVIPDAPKYVGNELLVTVDADNIHWYKLADQVEINSAFAGTLKFDVEVTKGKSKYLIWNADQTAFYVLKPMSFAIKSYIEKKDGGYNASEVTSWTIDAKIPQETPQVFFFVDDEYLQERDIDGNYSREFLVSNPNEHFVEYVYVAKVADVSYSEKTENSFEYAKEKKFPRYDYFYVKPGLSEEENPQDRLTVYVDAAKKSTLLLNAIGAEKNRVELKVTSENQEDVVTYTTNTSWDDSFQGHENSIVFDWNLIGSSSRIADIYFKGVPDSVFFTYGNCATSNVGHTRLEVSYSTSESSTLIQLAPRIDGVKGPVAGAYALPENANRIRLHYWGAANEGYVSNLVITEKKKLTVANDTIDFGNEILRAPGKKDTKIDSLTWVNLAPRLTMTVDSPFIPLCRIPVRLDQWSLNAGDNKYAVILNRDNEGFYLDTMVVASMDYPEKILDTVILKGRVIFDQMDMFARVNNQLEGDTIQYGDTAVITITDALDTVLNMTGMDLQYTYNTDSLTIDPVTGKVYDVCVGVHPIYLSIAKNERISAAWADTLYIDARENEADSLTFNIPAEIGMKDTLPADFVVALDSVAQLTYEFDKPEYFEVTAEGRLVALKNAKADSVWVKVTASQTCEHFAYSDSVRLWVRRIVTPSFNDSVEWMTNVFGNDTLNNPFQVLNDDATELENTDNLTIVFDYNPNDVVVDSVANQWYMRRSTEDSLFIKVTVSGDSIKTVEDSIKFPVKEYIASITWPGTVDQRGFYYVGDTLKVGEFTAKAINQERKDKDLTKLVNWTKTFVEAADGTVLEDGSVLLDSISTSVLQVCLDTLFVKDTCAYDTLIVKPAVVKDLIFPGVDGIYTVGDSIAVRDIVVKDTADRDISRYVRYYFEYIPEDFAHNTADSLNKFIDSVFTDYIVLDKNGLDTTAVDTIVSKTQGGLVTESEFKDRLLIAPVYAVSIKLPAYEFTVGDTLYVDDIKAYDAKKNDVTRYSDFMFGFANGVAHRVEGGIVFDQAGDNIQIKVIAKRNESMHQGIIFANVKVNPVKVKYATYGNTELNVFDAYNTDSVRLFDAKDREITDYASMKFNFDGKDLKDNSFVVTEEGSFMLKTIVAEGNVAADTLNQEITVAKYAGAKVVFDAKEFVVGDEVEVSRFSLVNAEGETIDPKYYTFSYDFDLNDAHWNLAGDAIVMDSLLVDVKVSVSADQKSIAPFDSTVQITVLPCTADRVVFPTRNFLVGEGFAIAELEVYDVKNRNITRYAMNEWRVDEFGFNPANRAQFNAAKDSIYFTQFGTVTITPALGTELVNYFSKDYKMSSDQVKATRIEIPAGPYIVGNKLMTSDFSVFAGDKDITSMIKDMAISMKDGEGHAVEGGWMMDQKGEQIVVRSEVIGRSNSENYVQYDTIAVEAVTVDRMQLLSTEYKVLDRIMLNTIQFFDANDSNITRYVDPSYYWDPATNAHMGEGYIEMDAAGDLSIYAMINGNAKAAQDVMVSVTVSAYEGANIVLDKKIFVIGDTLTPASFRLVDAQGNTITPTYGEIKISCTTPEYGENLTNGNILFNKAGIGAATIVAEFVGGDIQLEKPFSEQVSIGAVEVSQIVFKDKYTLGDTIRFDELVMLNEDGEDITRYAKNSIQMMEDQPDESVEISIANGYIVLNMPGYVKIKTLLMSDSISMSLVTNDVFVDNIVPTDIVFPKKNYQVGDTMLVSDVRVYAGSEDITRFADVSLIVDERDAHYLANGVVFDLKSAAVRVQAKIGGYTGVKLMVEDTTYNVAAVEAKDVNLPQVAAVMQVINTTNLIFKDANNNDITKYANSVSYAFNNQKARWDEATQSIICDSVGEVVVTVTLDGNAAGVIEKTIQIQPYVNAEIKFAKQNATFYVADLVELRDFSLVDKTTGKLIYTDYKLSISCARADGEKEGENIRLNNKGSIKVTVNVEGQVQIADQDFYLTVEPAKPAYVIYPEDGTYEVGKSIAIKDIVVKDSMNRDITKYLKVADFLFVADPEDAAKAEGENINFYKAGKMYLTASFGNEVVEHAEITSMLSIDQQEAAYFTMVEKQYQVGDTLPISDVKIFDEAGNDITEQDKLFFIYSGKQAHSVENGLVFDKATAEFNLQIAIKGYENVMKFAFDTVLNVLPRTVAEIVMPLNSLEVLDTLDAEAIQVLDIYGNDMMRTYAEVTVSFDQDSAKSIGNKIVFYKSGTVNIHVMVGGNAIGDSVQVITVAKNTTAEITTPKVNFYYVGDEVHLNEFALVDKNGKAFDAEYSLSFDIDSLFGRKLDDNTIVIDSLDAQIVVKAEGEVEIADKVFDPEIKPCEVDRVVFPKVPYIVGDSIKIADLVLLDATNRDLTRYAEYTGFEFEASTAARADLQTGYIYFLEPGIVEVTTKVGVKKMAVANLSNQIFILQAAADSVALQNNVRTVGDTLDITEFEAFDKNGNKLTIYSDMQFSFAADEAHYVVAGQTNKIILDKAGKNIIDIIVDGRRGVMQKTLTPDLTINPVAITNVVINGNYKVTDILTTAVVEAFAGELNVTQYVGAVSYSIDPTVARPSGEGYMLIKSGNQTINVVLEGANIVPTTVPVVKDIAKCEAARVEFPDEPENSYRVGDIINKSDFVVYDANGMNITEFADITFTFNDNTIAKVNADGNIEIIGTGAWTLNVNLSRDVKEKVFSENYFVRHNTKDHTEYDLLVQVWEDLIVVDNNNADLPMFVSYVWYMDEQVIAGQTSQNFYVRDEDYDGKEHVIYVIATDANGKQYLINEQTFVFVKDQAAKKAASIKTTTYQSVATSYMVETSDAGEVLVSNTSGAAVDRFKVEQGNNMAVTPASAGIYVLHFTASDGQVATQKIIVK